MVNFKDLEVATSRLNKESDSINETIKAYQDNLYKLNPGLEVWLDDRSIYALGKSLPEETKFEEEELGTVVGTKQFIHYLGYAKIGDKWGLAIKTDETVEFYHDVYEEMITRIWGTKYAPLLGASRTLRIVALEKMQDLINMLEKRVNAALQMIEKAKTIAEKK